MADAIQTPLRLKLKAILDDLPTLPTNGQNATAIRRLITLIDDMEVARAKSMIEGSSMKVFIDGSKL